MVTLTVLECVVITLFSFGAWAGMARGLGAQVFYEEGAS